MRRVIYIVLCFALLVSCQNKQENFIHKEWISTYSGFMTRPGILLEMTNEDTLISNSISYNRSEKKFNYKIDAQNNLVLQDSIELGKIIKQTDRILLLKDSFRVQAYISLVDYHLNLDTAEIKVVLASNDWAYTDWSGQYRFKFYEDPWSSNLNHLYSYLRVNELTGWESTQEHWWTIEKYKESILLILSSQHSDYQFYQVKSVSDSLILCETCWSDSVIDVQFTSKKKIAEEGKNKLQKTLSGKWDLVEFTELADSSILLVLEEEIIITRQVDEQQNRNRPYSEEDSVPIILDTYYKNKSINYHFSSEGKCEMNAANTNLRQSNWSLSDDGQYINTSYGWLNQMKIISISDSILIIEKHETIEYATTGNRYRNDWKDVYIRETLKKSN